MMTEVLKKMISEALKQVGLSSVEFVVEAPAELAHGDYATNAALVAAKQAGTSSRAVAEQLVEQLQQAKSVEVAKIEIAGPGFINFYLAPAVFTQTVQTILEQGDKFGHSDQLAGQKIIVEYTDPNPFKEFHIGHLMSNTVGESISRLLEASGAEVKRACYQGDVGLHVAKAILGAEEFKDRQMPSDDAPLGDKIVFWGMSYASGSALYESSEVWKSKVVEINKKIYQKSDPNINKLYETGRQASLDYFETIYKKLGTKFDFYFFESETGEFGKKLVEQNLGKIFEQSDGATIFRGEQYGTHTRVFINSEGLPTYEAKELGLAKIKYDRYPYSQSIVVTGNEIVDYFKVLLAAMNLVFPNLATKTKHLPHGMLRLPSGKMSSRTGHIITGESLLQSIIEKVKNKMARPDSVARQAERGFNAERLAEIAEQVAVAAIKYSILKQAPGRDIIFSEEKSLAFEGDSGPYLQYAYVRTRSLLRQAKRQPQAEVAPANWILTDSERLLGHFPDVVKRATADYAPQLIINYLLALTSSFNHWYATEQIVGAEDEGYKLALASAIGTTIKNGLGLLGIAVPEEM